MKKFLLLACSLLLLGACSNANTSKDTNDDKAKVEKVKEHNVGDEELEKVGDFYKRDGAKLTLVKIVRPEGKHQISENVNVDIFDIRIMKVTDIAKDSIYKQLIEGFKEGDYILEVSLNAENKEKQSIQGLGMPTIVTSTGEQLNPTTVTGDYEILPGANADTGCIAQIKPKFPQNLSNTQKKMIKNLYFTRFFDHFFLDFCLLSLYNRYNDRRVHNV